MNRPWLIAALLLFKAINAANIETLSLPELEAVSYLLALAGNGPTAQKYFFCLHCRYRVSKLSAMSLHVDRYHPNINPSATVKTGALLRQFLDPAGMRTCRRSKRLLGK